MDDSTEDCVNSAIVLLDHAAAEKREKAQEQPAAPRLRPAARRPRSTNCLGRARIRLTPPQRSFFVMAYPLDIVPIGVEHEGAVVSWMIMRAQTRRAVVAAACGDGGPIEGIDFGAAAGVKGNMHAGTCEPPALIQKSGLGGTPNPVATIAPVSGAATSIIGT